MAQLVEALPANLISSCIPFTTNLDSNVRWSARPRTGRHEVVQLGVVALSDWLSQAEPLGALHVVAEALDVVPVSCAIVTNRRNAPLNAARMNYVIK